MKLLFVIKSLAVPAGGAERVLAEVTSALAARGHDVSVMSYDPSDSIDFYRVDPAVRRIRLGIGRPLAPSRVKETVQRMTAVRRAACGLQPDVVIGFMHSTYLPLGAALLGTGLPVIASEHIVFGHYSNRPFEALLMRLCAGLFAGFTATSASVRSTFPDSIRARMSVIPNPVMTAPRYSADVVGGERKRLLSVGRLTGQKDHRTLIDSFARVAPAFPDWDLRIVGEGELRGALEAQIESYQLGGRVKLPGAIRDIDSEYRAAQLFALSSLYESFGLVTAEALARGLPVIGFADCPGTNEIIENGRNGVLVSGTPRTVALADVLAALMGNPEIRQRLGEAGPTSIEQFALEGVVDLWEALLRRTLGNTTPKATMADLPSEQRKS